MSRVHSKYDTLKRILDAAFALVLVVLLSPLLGLIALAVLLTMGRPVLFAQQRPGKCGRTFTLYKFRTMRPAPACLSAVEACSSDGERLTRLGIFLRATSLDEWPQLFNVLLGDMSFVGPRPLLIDYLDHYTPEQARRHEVRPGITGLAQVSGRNDLSWEERFALDVRYVDERSFGLDAQILWRTFAPVLAHRGVTHAEHATMRPFVEVTGASADNDMGSGGPRPAGAPAATEPPEQASHAS
jgi:lipopolysaccharide/colanic/teichoic acid biosynthesis glycosyltransferase